MSIFEELRALDACDEPRSLRFSTTDLPLWPFVRWSAFSAAQERALGHQAAFATTRSVRQTAELLVRSQLRGPASLGAFDVVIVGSSAGLVVQRAGRWFDRINDYFAMELPGRTLILDKAAPTGYKAPRFPPHVACYDTFDIRAGMLARMRRPAARDIERIDALVDWIRTAFPVAIDVAPIRAQLVHWAVRLPLLRDAFAKFFAKVMPRLLFIEDGSYGGFTHVFAWARAAGIATAEFQHGLIARTHLAYNVGPIDAACLPQHLLLYGEGWRDEVRSPSEITVAGCPHFSEVAKRATGSRVLVISQGIVTEQMVQLTSALAKALPAKQIVFRLHPGEVPFRERYAALSAFGNVEVSDRGDIYELLASAGVAIGHSSTALVEAAGVGLPVLVLDDEASRATMPQLGTWFRTAGELVALVESPPSITYDPERYFAAGWRERYRSFVARVAP